MELGNLSTCEGDAHDVLGAGFATVIECLGVGEAAIAVAMIGGFVFTINGEGYGGMLREVLLEEGFEKLDGLGTVAFPLMSKVDKEGTEAKLVG